MWLKRISALAVAVTGLVVCAPASADYTVWSCRGPDGAPLGAAAWRAGGVDGTRSDTCATGGGLEVTLPASTGARAATGFLAVVPPGATIDQARLSMSARTGGGGFQAGVALGNPYFAPVLQDGCADGAAACDVTRETVVDGPLDALSLIARCFGSGGCSAPAGPHAVLTRSALDFHDVTPPTVGAVHTSADTVSAPVSDAGGGVLRRTLLVDGAEVQRADGTGTCVEPFTVPAPCPSDTVASFDVGGLAAGDHTVAIAATDAAGLTTRSADTTFTVGQDATVTLPDRLTLPRYAPVRGRAAPGMRVVLTQRAFGARRWQPFDSVRAGADGRFSFPAGTRSRQVRAGDAVVDLVAPLGVALAPHPGVARNGRVLTLTGAVTGAGGTPVAVSVQAVVRGHWQDIGHTAADGDGRIAWRYRLTNSTVAADYQFRFRVPAVPGLPWKTAVSRARTVAVRP